MNVQDLRSIVTNMNAKPTLPVSVRVNFGDDAKSYTMADITNFNQFTDVFLLNAKVEYPEIDKLMQYRSLQALEPQLFQDGLSDDEVLSLQAQFMAHVTVPESETANTDDAFRQPHTFRYDANRAETAVAFWRIQLPDAPTLFHICFQVFHTAVQYYSRAYPLLFSGDSKSQEFRDALQGEVGTVNTVMKYAGYSDQQQVYDSYLPFVLDILNTMTKEAKEIEKIKSQSHRGRK